MTWRIKEIDIENLKFYSPAGFSLDSKGRNVLMFGENGAGKSSIFWSVYTHFQAAYKSPADAAKYFDPAHPENLRNRFSHPGDYSGIKLTFQDASGLTSGTYEDSSTGAYISNPVARDFMKKTAQTSDFLNYKIIASIFDFKNSEPNDIFSILKKEVFHLLDFSTELKDLNDIPLDTMNAADWWQWLKSFDSLLPHNVKKPNTYNVGHPAYKMFELRISEFNNALKLVMTLAVERANAILSDEFNVPVELDFDYEPAHFNEIKPGHKKTRTGELSNPRILMKARYVAPGVVDTGDIRHPKSFFNEAKLSCMGIALRLAILEQRSPVAAAGAVLFIDDLLHSLDMSVRKTVIPFLLTYQAQWQMIVLTHDRAMFNIFLKEIDKKGVRSDWRVLELYSIEHPGAAPEPYLCDQPNLLKKARIYLNECRVEECANTLRKFCERHLKRILPPMRQFDPARNKIKDLNSLIEEFNRFFVVNCRMPMLNGLYHDMMSDKRLIMNPFSHDDINSPFYRGELDQMIKDLEIFEKLRVYKALPPDSDIRTAEYKLTLSKMSGGILKEEWVKFFFMDQCTKLNI